MDWSGMVDSTDKDKTQFHTGEFVYVMPDENAIGNQQRDEIKGTEQSKNKKKSFCILLCSDPLRLLWNMYAENGYFSKTFTFTFLIVTWVSDPDPHVIAGPDPDPDLIRIRAKK